MNIDDLIIDCLNFAFDHGISYHIMPFPVKSDPSMVLVKSRMMIINRAYINHRQLPFQICHEIAHILHNDDFHLRNYGDIDVSISMEYTADELALHILLPIYLSYINDPTFMSVTPIMKTLELPRYLSSEVKHITRPLISIY